MTNSGPEAESQKTSTRGDLQSPQTVARPRNIQRTMGVKIALNWKREEDRKLYGRLRELSWQAMRYGNDFIRRRWAQSKGWRLTVNDDKNGITKEGRKEEKCDLSAAVSDAIEREVQGLWTRHGKRIFAGAQLPGFREGRALSIRDRGVRVERLGDGFVINLAVHRQTYERGCWIALPIAKGVRVDEYLEPILSGMANGEIRPSKATVEIRKESREVLVRLSYPLSRSLPAMGSRVATLGPVSRHGLRLLLRTECETRDFSDKLHRLVEMKDQWDLIRRRAMVQIGKRRHHARIKRRVLARMSWDSWLKTFLHNWSAELISWLVSQGVGTLHVCAIATGDWPADRFTTLLTDKGKVNGITIDEIPNMEEKATDRALGQEQKRQEKRGKKAADALRELEYQATST